MHIERLQIEGGFLDALDVRFSDGLNVLIGARGTGKTSVIELLRFALTARNHTAEATKRSKEHAEAVLDDGVVTVELNDLIDSVTVSRSISDDAPRMNGRVERPLVFSQTEIENLGLSEGGRLRLLDAFVFGGTTLATEEAAAVAAIRSIFKEIAAAEQDRDNLANGLEKLATLRERIKLLELQEVNHQASSTELATKQLDLSEIGKSLSNFAVREEVLERFSELTKRWADSLETLVVEDFGTEDWDEADGDDPLKELRSNYETLVSDADVLSDKFLSLSAKSAADRDQISRLRMALEGKSRSLRAEVEQSVAGAGAISRQLSQLRTEAAQLATKRKLVDDREQRIEQLRSRRNERIKELDKIRAERFARRQTVAKALTTALAPQVRVIVERYGQYAEYSKALTEALRGSGMRYADLVSSLTQSVSPYELVGFIDSNDFTSLADIASIPKDRAARLLGHLREVGSADIVVASIEDNVRMSLLDGVGYKDVEYLSAGQRCTVILSVVLQHTSRTLIIDQPEDHLDNAYIANTIIKAIHNRKSHGQLIISTHNANIPVLGEADLIIEMTSDGRNGFVQVCEKLSSKKAVDAITNVMEGGREAFSNRAAFYNGHPSK